MTALCTMFVIFVHLVIILVILHFQDEIMKQSLFYHVDNIFAVYPNTSKLQIIYVSGCLLFCLYFNLSTCKSKQTLRIILLNAMFMIMLIWFINLDLNLNSDGSWDLILTIPGLTFCTSTIILFQWITYDDALIFNAQIFNAQISSKKHVYFTIHILYNIIINVHSFIIVGIENLSLRTVTTLEELAFVSIMLLPYYILPPLKYDLFFAKFRITAAHYIIFIRTISRILWLKCGNYMYLYLLDTWSLFSFLLIVTIHTVILSFYGWRQKRLFHKHCVSKNQPVSWLDYIHLSAHNYYQFLRFLSNININCVGNVLIILDIMSYKRKLLQMDLMNVRSDDVGLLLNCSDKTWIPISFIAQRLNYTEKVYENVADDMLTYFVQEYVVDRESVLYATFLSNGDADKIQKRMKQYYNQYIYTTDKENIVQMIKVFDKSMTKINTLLQLLYREYQLLK
eukprot:428301_1